MTDVSDWLDTVRKKMDEKEKVRRRQVLTKAARRWRSGHREHYNNYQREYYAKRKADPEYRAKRQAYAHAQYLKRKEKMNERISGPSGR